MEISAIHLTEELLGKVDYYMETELVISVLNIQIHCQENGIYICEVYSPINRSQ